MPDIGLAAPALARRSALARLGRLPQGAGFTVAEVGPLERFVLQGGDAVVERAGAALGLRFECQPLRATTKCGRVALWLGPREFLMLAAEGTGIGATLAPSLAGLPHSLVDVSHRQVSLMLEGPRTAEVLAAGCPLDLHASAFPVGMCTRTIFCKAEIVLWRPDIERFHVEVWQSFAAYVTGLLGMVAAEVG